MTRSRQLRILIVRHGETAENVAKIIQGQLDTPLNDHGREQARATASFLSCRRIHRAIASPLKRAADTAKAIVEAQDPSLGLTLEFDDRLKERAFGSLEGHVYRGPAKKPEDTLGIEKMPELIERLASFWNYLITDENYPDSEAEYTVLLVSHGAAISALVNEVLLAGRYYDLGPQVRPSRFHNCSITEILSPTIPRGNARFTPGDMAHQHTWSIRPAHLDIQGAQLVRDYTLLKAAMETGHGHGHGHTVSAEMAHKIAQTERRLAKDPKARALLEQDIVRCPDGEPVVSDIGFGRGIGRIVSWSDSEHLDKMHDKEASVNVDELVAKGQ